MRSLRTVVTLLFLLASTAMTLSAQTATTAAVTGTITDPSGAVVPNATIELRDLASNTARTAVSNDVGQYAFSNVRPGNYKVTITASGFRQLVVPSVSIQVATSPELNFKLQVGVQSQIVEVTAVSGVQLQTLDASVGNVLGENELKNLPTLSRDATALLLLQPTASPGFNTSLGTGESNVTAGGVAGTLPDQNTFIVDGGDATSNTEGGGGYNTGFTATPRAVVPTPVESLEEFRVTTNNPNATFSRSAGGEVQMVTRRGSNAWHGAAYEYNQNREYNANTWENNRIGIPRTVWLDNRFGARVGGPIFKDRTFFFVHYEGRRFKKGEPFTRLVPSELMKQGILQFRDAAQNLIQYNLKTSTQCSGPGGLCDPRQIGINPLISTLWNQFEPTGNDPTQGDGINVIGRTGTVPVITNEEFGVARFDHKINKNWDFMTSFRYGVTSAATSDQVDIGGITPGAVKGVPKGTRQVPLQPRYLVAGLTGRIGANFTNDFRFNWLRHWWQWGSVDPFPQVPGTAAALSIAGKTGSSADESRVNSLIPLNVDTQKARSRVWNGKDYVWTDNASLLKGKHLIQFGGEWRTQRFLHIRNDKVVGVLTTPVYHIVKGSSIDIPDAFRPPTCSSTVTTNCLQPGDAGRWNTFYTSVLGLVDHGGQLLTRDANLNPQPPGTVLKPSVLVNAAQLYAGDTWRITPSLTLTYGLTWTLQLPPFDRNGASTIMVDNATKEVLDAGTYFTRRAQAAAQGKAYNPELAFVPIRQSGRKYPYDVEWKDLGPRFAFAWNPSLTGGWAGKLFGDRKTVIRGGYSRAFDRVNGVGIVMIPALGIGFGNASVCRGPRATGGCGGSGADPNTAFRIGVDGSSIPIPTLSPISPPLVPGSTANANSPLEKFDFRLDTKRHIAVEEMFDLSIQRELPFNTVMEVGYIGRLGRHLVHGASVSQIPYMFTAGGQTYAKAFDNIATALRSGTSPAAVPNQPWFETMLGSGGTQSAIKSEGTSNFTDGLAASTWTDLESSFVVNPPGCTPIAGGGCALVPFNVQLLDSQWITSQGTSNYNAGFVTVRKRMSHGLAFQANYTYSKSLDKVSATQENDFTASDSFNLNRDYGPSLWDRKHVFNAFFVYEFPFGKGKRFSASNWLDRLIGGWSVSGIYTISSGLPLDFLNSNSCQEFGDGPTAAFTDCADLIPLKKMDLTSSRHNSVTGSAGVGTAGNVNAFQDPAAVFNNFRPVLFSDLRTGRGALRGLRRWSFDAGLSKAIPITERVSMRLDLQAINVFNHPQLSSGNNFTGAGPGNLGQGGFDFNTDFADPPTFGVLSNQYNSPRFLNIGIRIDF